MKIKIIILFIALLALFMGCKKLSVPSEVIIAEPTLTQLPAAQTTQTAVALQTAGVTAQQTATAQAQMTASAVVTQTATGVVMVDSETLISVPGGTFTQTDGYSTFQHTISSFKIGKYEVTYELWYTVRQWAILNGYSFQNSGREGSCGTIGLAPTDIKYEPVTVVNWRDCIVWCNAYSQMKGLTPVYCSDVGLTIPIKDSTDGTYGNDLNTTPGSFDNPYVNWSANGYRLPTEGEWQYAASYKDGISWTPYNYASGASASYDNLMAIGLVAWYEGNSWDSRNYYVGYITHRVGGKNANALGIYDMSGNIGEWCWDWYGNYPTGSNTNYKGPSSGSYRVVRGGHYHCYSSAVSLQVGSRYYFYPYNAYYSYGFRFVRTY